MPMFAVGTALCMLLCWAQYEAFWVRHTPRINVRWSDTATTQAQEALATDYGLTEGRQEEGRTWSYLPTDRRVATIRRLVEDPAVEDTHNFNRETFELTGDNPPGLFTGRNWLLWSSVLSIVVGLLLAWIGHSRLRGALAVVARPATAVMRAVATFMTRGIPETRAEVLGVFRYFFAVALFIALRNESLVLEAGQIPDDGQLGWAWLGWLASRPELMAGFEVILLVLLVPFAIGLWTRVAYGLFATGFSIWSLVWIESQHSNAHPLLATLVMVVCLLPVPWGAALSVDEVLQRRRGRPTAAGVRGKLYGYPLWMPGLILGTVWVSAAYSKLESSGIAWILGGAVKYHWVIDAPVAKVEWGLWVASHHWAAVLMAFCGVFFEAVFILAVFAQSLRWRLLWTSTGLPLLVGFSLLHGVNWWHWWLVFLSFAIPWEACYNVVRSRGRPVTVASGHARESTAGGRLRGRLHPVHMVLIIAVCMHAAFRLPAGFGRFGAYSGTYASTDAFDRINPIDPVDRVWVGYGTNRAVEINAAAAVEAILRLSRREPLPPATVRALQALRVGPFFAGLPQHVTLTRQRRTFDWRRGQFTLPAPPVVVGTLDLESMTLVGTAELGLGQPPLPTVS